MLTHFAHVEAEVLTVQSCLSAHLPAADNSPALSFPEPVLKVLYWVGRDHRQDWPWCGDTEERD